MAAYLRLGDVVRGIEGFEGRGTVVWSNGKGIHGHFRLNSADSYVIEHDHGHYIIGNMVSAWKHVPEVEWTTRERVLSELVAWEFPTWRDPEEGIPEADELGFALMRGLLPPDIRDEIFSDSHWPMNYEELAMSVARWLDDELLHRQVLNGLLNYAD